MFNQGRPKSRTEHVEGGAQLEGRCQESEWDTSRPEESLPDMVVEYLEQRSNYQRLVNPGGKQQSAALVGFGTPGELADVQDQESNGNSDGRDLKCNEFKDSWQYFLARESFWHFR